MAAALARRCELLSVVSAHAENVADWRASGLSLVEVPTYSSWPEALLSLARVGRLLALRSRIRAHSPDVLYYPMVHPWAPALNALLPEVAKVLTVHDPVLHLGERNPAVALLQRVLVRQSARVIVLSRHAAAQATAQGVPAAAVDVVPHGEFSLYGAAGPRDGAPAPDGDTLLFFGRIYRYKGIDVLLEAFRAIRERRPATRLLLVGSGDLDPYASRLGALPGVTVVNRWVPDDEVHPYFARAALVVLPYLDGSQSGVIPIAYAHRLPVVASRVGGIPDQVVDGETGLLVAAGDAGALAAACLSLLESPERRDEMGRKAAALAAREWSWDAAAAKVLESLGAAALARRGRRALLRWPST